MVAEMKALILAGGMGVRLRPITDTRPKPLIPILCRPILDWHLSNLSRINVIDSIRIVVSYMKEKIQSFVENRGYGVQYEFIDQVEELGTGDAVIKGVKGLGYDDEILIVYGDVYLSDSSIIEKIASMDGNVVLGARVGDPEKYGVLIVENGFLKRIEEKPVNPPSNLVFTGISKLKVGDVIEHSDIGFSVRGEMEFTDILTRIANSKQLRVIEIDGENWVDIGYPWNVIEANKLALKSIGRDIRGLIEDHVTIKGNVYVGEGSEIKSGTYIEGPVYIDKHVEVGPNARIRPYSVICSGSRIGFSVEVKESVIMENVRASHLSYIGDSVICENVNLGAGTMIANLRFDNKPVKVTINGKRISSGRRKFGAVIGANVKTGVNVSIMPGVKIGSNTWISPGSVVWVDVPQNSFYKSSVSYTIEELKEH